MIFLNVKDSFVDSEEIHVMSSDRIPTDRVNNIEFGISVTVLETKSNFLSRYLCRYVNIFIVMLKRKIKH